MADSALLSVLFICTGNVCRTPMAVGFLNERASRLGLPLHATSVGLWRTGEPATPDGVAVMATHGIDTSEHRSRMLDAGHVSRADIIIGLAREHLREAVVLDPGSFPHSFTLKELVRRAEQPGAARRVDDGEEMLPWLERLSTGRTAQQLLGTEPADDVADPIGQNRAAYEATALEIRDLVDRFLATAFPFEVSVAGGRES